MRRALPYVSMEGQGLIWGALHGLPALCGHSAQRANSCPQQALQA